MTHIYLCSFQFKYSVVAMFGNDFIMFFEMDIMDLEDTCSGDYVTRILIFFHI